METRFTSCTLPAAPRELIGPPPRKVHLYRNGTKLGIIAASFLVFFVISSAWFCADAVRQIEHKTALQHDGREVIGEITEPRLGNRTSEPSVTYAFTVRGTAYSGRAQMPQNLAGSLRESDHILVRFLPSDPKINHPDAWAWSPILNLESVAVQILFAIIGGVIIAVLRSERRLASEGMPSIGVITICTPKNRTFWVKYDFSTEDGRSIKGSGYSLKSQEIGTNICVLYLPQNPRRNCPYPLSNFCVEAGGPTFN